MWTACASSHTQSESISMTDTLPTFTVAASDGTAFTDETLRGAPAVLWFYPRADTPGCTTEAADFTRLTPEFETLGVRLFGASPDKPSKVARFKEKRAIGPVLLADEDAALAKAFGVWVEKNMYGRTSMGVERSTFLVDAEGKIVETWRKVKVAGHADAVLDAARKRFG